MKHGCNRSSYNYGPDGSLLLLVRRDFFGLGIGVRVQAHHLGLLELLAPDEVPPERGSDLGHHRRRVLLHGVVPRLRQVTHEPEYGDPECQGSLDR